MTRLATVLFAATLMGQAHALPAAKSPLEVPAPTDAIAAKTRLVGVAAIDRTKGRFAAVGPWGKILVSDDRGTSWTQRPSPVSSDLVAITFPTPQKGWAVGHDGVILHSSDGGASWTRQLDGRQYGELMLRHYEGAAQAGDAKIARAVEDARRFKDEGPDKPFLAVWFENERSGWVVGAFNLILKTDDGGKNWRPWIERTDNEDGKTLFAIGGGGGEVYLVGELGLVRRLDRTKGGFVRLETPYPGSFFGVTARRGVVVAFGLRGNAWRSFNEGKSWQKLETGLTSGITGGIYLDDGRLVLVGTDGKAIVSKDDGDHFYAAFKGSMPLNGLAQIGGDEALIVGEHGARPISLKLP